MADLLIGLAATKAAWSTALRSYVRDHTQGIAVEIIMDRFALARSGPISTYSWSTTSCVPFRLPK